MEEKEKTSYDPQIELAKKMVNHFVYEMKDDRNDGYIKQYYRDRLLELRDFIDKNLK